MFNDGQAEFTLDKSHEAHRTDHFSDRHCGSFRSLYFCAGRIMAAAVFGRLA